ncbi:MAG TPA: enoyl-CoA hydratase/isomerase family protein [Thermoanaerobaculia bacterium]
MIQTLDHGPVRELRLDRPPANALDPELVTALREAVEAAPGDGVRALVLSGSPRMFSGGLDVPYLIHLDRPAMSATWRDFYAMMRALATSPIPIAAAITGHAPAGGAVISLFCDARIMADGDFKIGLNEVPVGIPLPPVFFKAMRRLVGNRQAERLCVAGLLIPPAEALRVGLIDELAPPEQVVERAVDWCRSLLALPPSAMSATRRMARADLAALFDAVTEEVLEGVLDEWFSKESQRVMRELVERLAKRKG